MAFLIVHAEKVPRVLLNHLAQHLCPIVSHSRPGIYVMTEARGRTSR